MPADTVGILTPIEFPAEQRTVVDSSVRQVFTNEQPLFSRLPHEKGEGETYTTTSYDVRGGANRRLYALGTGGLALVSTVSLPIVDASMLQVGDVLEIDDGTNMERVEVLSPPVLTTTPNTLLIRRARENTVAAVFAAGAPLYLIGNARTGAEVDQQGFRPVSSGILQIIQTFQFPVQVGGKADAITNVALPPGSSSVMGQARALKMIEFVRDVENTIYYGRGEVPVAAGDRGKMKGIRSLVQGYNVGSNYVGAAGANYSLAAFVAASIGKIYSAGGMADTILCSTDFLGFLNTWVPGKQTTATNGATTLGYQVRSFTLPLNGEPLLFVPAPQLRPGTAAVLSSSDLKIKFLREMFWEPRGSQGDAKMGDWIGDYAIHMEHPQWHAWVQGITSVA